MTRHCVQEPQVRHAAIEDRWTTALREHASACQDCAAAAAIAPFMTRLARTEVRHRTLPDPGVIWLKARLIGGTAIAERAARPLNVAQIVTYLVLAAGWAGLLTWKWAEVQRWLLGFTPANMVSELAGVQPSFSASVVLTFVVLSSLTVLLGLHAILAEE